MNRLDLGRALRGPPARALLGLLEAGSARVEDPSGRVIVGGNTVGTARYGVIAADGEEVGAVIGDDRAEPLARLVAVLYDRELEKRDLAEETLGRYKELTLLYDMTEKLSTLLDLDAVASFVVSEARRHLRGRSASLLLHDPRQRGLEVVAWVGETEEARSDPLTERVFATGRAEVVEDRALCAPLRVGERVYGVMYVAHQPPRRWTAGDLKLVSAIAANAASAISNARLHGDRMREQALRHRVERHLSPRLADAVFDGGVPTTPLAVALCDMRNLYAASHRSPSDTDSLVRLVEAGVTAAVDVFATHEATVDMPQGELVIGVFPSPEAAIAAARGLLAALAGRGLGGLVGVGIAATDPRLSPVPALQAAVKAAAALGAESVGQILVDDVVAAAATDAVPVPGARGFEVRT